MTERERLHALIDSAAPPTTSSLFLNTSSGQVGRGHKPVHYKRCTIPPDMRDDYAERGAIELISAFAMQPYYTQALIAGVVLSEDYDDIAIVTCSQYGKSYLMGHLALLLARAGHSVNVAAATADKTTIIMRHCLRAASHAAPDIKRVLSAESLKKIDRLDQSLSKERISFPDAGDVQGITLGALYNDLERNQAVGRSGAYIVDEAAQVNEASLAETSRREFSSVDGKTEPLIMISNPHKKGLFYDRITADDALFTLPAYKRKCVIWMDARTAVEEGRWDADHVYNSDFAKMRDTCTRYLLCELPLEGEAMFGAPLTYEPVSADDSSSSDAPDAPLFDETDTVFMGIDTAYKGKDTIQICLLREHNEHVYVTDIEEIDIRGSEWIDGVTPKQIAHDIARIYHSFHCAHVCLDIAYGIWLYSELFDRGCLVRAINFAEKPTPSRRAEDHYSAKYAANKRAEMHLDLQDLIDNQVVYFSKEALKKTEDAMGVLNIVRKDNGQILITPKSEVKAVIGHSPDAFDALLLAIHAYLMYNFDGYGYA